MMRIVVGSIIYISPYHFTLSFTFYFSNNCYKPSTPSLDYITISLGKLNDTKPIILEVQDPHIDPILQGFVLLRVVFIVGTLHTTSMCDSSLGVWNAMLLF
jgi:hypothetical protein